MATQIEMDQIDKLTAGRFGARGWVDVACPWCGPDRRTVANQRRPVLRIWRDEPEFASFCCARCGESGFALRGLRPGEHRPPIDNDTFLRHSAERRAMEQEARRERLGLARWLWGLREPAPGSIVETYLRDVRGYGGAIPDTVAFLPPRRDHAPAMIAAFGLAEEPEPGALAMPLTKVAGVHLTKLKPDGSGKAGLEKDRVMVGYSKGAPIVLAPMNDQLGLAIVEGIEKGLAIFQATGLGVWVAGAAGRMPSLAKEVPEYTDCVSIHADDDKDGRRHAETLRTELGMRGIYVERIVFG